MKFYDIDSEFTFGKYEGQTIKEVFEKDPKYIDFCFNNIDEFYVSPDVMKELRSLDPRFTSAPAETDDELDDDMFDNYLDESGVLEDMDESFLSDEDELSWDDDGLGFDDEDDDFENYDDYDDEDDY